VRGTAAALTLQHVIHVEVADLCGVRLNIHLTRVNPLGAYFELGRSANVQRSFGSFEKDRAVGTSTMAHKARRTTRPPVAAPRDKDHQQSRWHTPTLRL
jgi:hypothetical protein